jgi:hypothetical protein
MKIIQSNRKSTRRMVSKAGEMPVDVGSAQRKL